MENIVNLFFEAKMLKEIQRSGLAFLGAGKESVAEHSFMVAFIGLVLSKMDKNVDSLKLISMCLLHDLAEARTGDMNYVQKEYVEVNEEKAVEDALKNVPFGGDLKELIQEFNSNETLEARLAKDADQLAFVLELKSLSDTGSTTPEKWLPVVIERIKSETGKKLAETIVNTQWDNWWLKNFVD